MNPFLIAAIWIGLALASALGSVRLGISVALVEIFTGFVAGNTFHLSTTPWIDFLASSGSVVLTFLAGAEIHPDTLRANFRESLTIGFFSFLAPAVGAFAAAYWIFRWNLHAAEIAGIALSTTSVAVVYAVMVESGRNETALGKIILAACFITDLGTVVALGLLFAHYDRWLAIFAAITAVAVWIIPKFAAWLFRTVGNRVSEPEIKLVLLILFGLGGLANIAGSEAVLPAYLMGLALARQFLKNRVLMHRMRALTFSLLTPFYFLKAGSYVSAKAMVSGLVLIAAFFAVKMVTKGVGVYPWTLKFRFGQSNAIYTTLLMATGLTFGTISALFGLTHGYIDQSQYTTLVTVVILSAFVPTLIAEKFFRPAPEPQPAPEATPMRMQAAEEGD
ncbi:MAG: cation:proton antiporter [Acidobacteria bacterium]|nr:cation:proton antiporter [Acidobacteriota bacterium]